ncbi:MAG TPA: arylesterase [Burkholderiales bacterium]|nr:arylesterase [Burkholderiales bacterium]
MVLTWGAAQAAPQKPILVLGDSLSAAYGIAHSRGWVALLAERLERERSDYSVVNASVSGDTTAGGRARLKSALERHRPAVVVIELGGNDGLRGLPVAQMRDNLAAMVQMARAAGARVLLVGMRIPPNYGPDYADAFAAAFEQVAKAHKTAFVPFFLEGFAEDPAMFQDDRIHPTEAAQPVMMERIWKALRPIL